jgi:type I restriction enzyme S subunit
MEDRVVNKTVAKPNETLVRRFKPYPAYKDPRVHWLGEVPAHWDVRRLKTIASVELSNVDKKSVEGQKSVRLCNYVDVYYNDRITPELDFMAATATADQVRRFSLRAGDVLITKDSESWTDIAVPAVVTSDLPEVLCGYHLALVRPRPGCAGAFLARAFSAIGLRDQFEVAANGITRFGLGGDAIQTGLFAVPPLEEQRAIAAFLDRETARIDALVAKKERLIELLQEKRTVLIFQAVTRGLDPNVPMKHSGVHWLGEIPSHWKFGSLSRWWEVIDCKHRTVPFLNEGVALASIYSRNATVGAAALVTIKEPFCMGQDVSLIRSASQDQRFLVFLLRSAVVMSQLEATMVGSTFNRINVGKIKRLLVTVPPADEQHDIGAFCSRTHERTQLLIDKIRDAIDRLKELRTALISAAVTGKIDVREEFA